MILSYSSNSLQFSFPHTFVLPSFAFLIISSLLSLLVAPIFFESTHFWFSFFVFFYAFFSHIPPRQSCFIYLPSFKLCILDQRYNPFSLLKLPRLPTSSPSLSITFHPITPTFALCALAPVCLSADYGAEWIYLLSTTQAMVFLLPFLLIFTHHIF